jgi:putative transcriptional regulator
MKKELFAELTESLRQAGSIRKGALKPSRIFNHRPLDVRRLRNRLHFSQSQFALIIGVNKATLQNWEQGRRQPAGPAKVLLTIVERSPQTVIETLHAS